VVLVVLLLLGGLEVLDTIEILLKKGTGCPAS
jgi:hypothetical protein